MLVLANLRNTNRNVAQIFAITIVGQKKYPKLSEDERALDFRFIMGIGYGKDVDIKHEYPIQN